MRLATALVLCATVHSALAADGVSLETTTTTAARDDADAAPRDAAACAATTDGAAASPFRRLLIGVMSVVDDGERRAAMRSTWVGDAKEVAPSLAVRFVLGRAGSRFDEVRIARENATHGDLVVLPCAENQHRGKTLHWFAHAEALLARDSDADPPEPADPADSSSRLARRDSDSDPAVEADAADPAGARSPRSYHYIAKMDGDAYVWPDELAAHVQGFARARFYGGAPWTHGPGNRHAPHDARFFHHVGCCGGSKIERKKMTGRWCGEAGCRCECGGSNQMKRR